MGGLPPSVETEPNDDARSKAIASLNSSKHNDFVAVNLCPAVPASVTNHIASLPEVPVARDVLLCVWHCNIQSFLSHAAELSARVRLAEAKPDVICLNETFLRKSTEHVDVEGFAVAARRDRNDGRTHGGVLVLGLVRIGLRDAVTCIKECDDCERLWLIMHSIFGPMLLGCWYRPPDSGADSIQSLGTNIEELAVDTIGTLVVGDLNVHHERWLRHSNGTTAEGRALFTKSADYGLEQFVKEPTRQGNLLDLCLSDLPKVECVVLPKIADQSVIQACLSLPMPGLPNRAKCKIWLMGAADWQKLSESLASHDWSSLEQVNPSDGAVFLTESILEHARECIPVKWICGRKPEHPWLNEKVLDLVQAKNHAENSALEAETLKARSVGILCEFQAWAAKIREGISSLRHGSK